MSFFVEFRGEFIREVQVFADAMYLEGDCVVFNRGDEPVACFPVDQIKFAYRDLSLKETEPKQ